MATSLINPNGFVSELELDEQNRVKTLLHKGTPRAAFTYGLGGRLETLTRFEDTGPVAVRYEADETDRPRPSAGSDGSNSLLAYDPSGEPLRNTQGEGAEKFEYTAQGDLRSVTQAGQKTVYTHNSDGQVELIESPRGTTRLSYFPDGKLQSIQFADGSVHEYRYNSLGFRRRVERSDGTHTTYEYDVAGNLIRSEGHQHTANSPAYGQIFDINDHNQPEIIHFSNGDSVNVTYDALGNPETITTSDPEAPALEYLYDGTNRVVAVQDGDAISGSHLYEDTEPDLRIQMDDRTMRVGVGAVRQSASVGNILSVMYTRPYGSVLDIVRFDEATRAFDLPSDFGSSLPDAVASNSLTRRMLRDVDLGSIEARVIFDRPSNVMYLPPEYATINCASCVFTGVILKGNGVTGNLSVPVGSTVNLLATKAFSSTCLESNILYTWAINGVWMPWSESGTQIHTFTTPGTYQVKAQGECTPCDVIRVGFLTVNVTTNPPPPVGPPVTITYTTFISLDHVRLASPYSEYFYEGDNHGSYVPGTSTFRTQQTVTVRTGQGISTGSSAQSTISRLYEANVPTANLTTSGDCYRKTCSNCPNYSAPFLSTPIVYQGQCMIRTAQPRDSGPAVDMSTVTAQLIGAGYSDANKNFVKVRLRGAPKIGVSPYWWSQAVSPAIDWDITIELTRNNSTGATTYKVTGGHDGFPFHDIRIGGTVVYQRDPIPTNTPQSLYGNNDITVSAQGSL